MTKAYTLIASGSLAAVASLVVGCDWAVALAPKHPTHIFVCDCLCPGAPDSDNHPTLPVPTAGCGSLNGKKCGDKADNTLKFCEEKLVKQSYRVVAQQEPVVTEQQ